MHSRLVYGAWQYALPQILKLIRSPCQKQLQPTSVMTLFKLHPIRRFRRRGATPSADLISGSFSKPMRHELDRLVSTGTDPFSRKVCRTISHMFRDSFRDIFASYFKPKWIRFGNYTFGISHLNQKKRLCK